MMLGNYTIVCILALASCTQERASKNTPIEKDSTTESAKEITMTDNQRYCFISSENRDTTRLVFTITSNQVVGEMNWIPFEKDSKKGSIKGTINNNVVNALWTYMQEGVQDTVNIAFKVSPEHLEQKPFIYNEKNQRLQTDQSADFTIIYKREDCNTSK